MVFNSIEFVVFLLISLTLYWCFFSKTAKGQNLLLLASSLFFYGWWDMRLLGMLVALSSFTWYCGTTIFQSGSNRKRSFYLYLHVLVSVGVLFVFKYFNFFSDHFHIQGVTFVNGNIVRILFPLGLSFYSFKNLSYVLDLYKDRSETVGTFGEYLVYAMFFPCIVSGPIDKSGPFLTQLAQKKKITLNEVFRNVNLIALGFFKKIMIADSIAGYVDKVFAQPGQSGSLFVLLGVVLYAFQIYADFSGYSDIAKGVAGLFGIDILANFNFPFFSRNIAEFWRRWHISLSTWLNDYVFNPLAISFRNLGLYGVYLAILVTFVISGIWHGEGWPFLVWGLLHALYYIPMVFLGGSFSGITTGKAGNQHLSIRQLPAILFTFTEVCFALVFFRASSITQAFDVLKRAVGQGAILAGKTADIHQIYKGLIAIALLLTYEIVTFNNPKFRFSKLVESITNSTARYCVKIGVYSCIFWILILWGGGGNKSFIYVKF